MGLHASSEKPITLQAIKTITANQTYTPVKNITHIIIEAVGAGGSGGGKGANEDSGGGAGSGGYAKKLIKKLAKNYAIIIGKGGKEQTVSTSHGNNGTSTIIKNKDTDVTIITCNGGKGGKQGNGYAQGGIGGTAQGGDINLHGNAGRAGHDGGTIITNYPSGQGAESKLGSIGTERINNTFTNQDPQYGSGGSGGQEDSNLPGQKGADGLVIVYEYGYDDV